MQGTVADTQTPSTQQNGTTLINSTDYHTCAPDLESDENGHETPLESSFPDSHSVFSEFVSLEVLKRDTTLSSDSSVSSDFFDDSVDQLILVLKHDSMKNMKQFLRTRFWMIDHEIRESLWLNLCRHLHKADGDIYEEMVTELFPDGEFYKLIEYIVLSWSELLARKQYMYNTTSTKHIWPSLCDTATVHVALIHHSIWSM
ncbi:hypothetical protein SNE40_001677 [Patella caerulea]|uniref:Uncharacterized protein n=1 Tax=Patella caerulea TaxID=87958 RepID=A0AAN8QI96_PATCE